ncbi:hypothetical protein Clacol_000242 [Clathrus columnatus]|uniref:BTB domain-containing protein n=1 Tax=Clathrus columnatus TaxID=1419009 RepID=A0AAV5A063_9AGAM|nr:hypothetical protein Clacol_000242 [Clathrus columnatus]
MSPRSGTVSSFAFDILEATHLVDNGFHVDFCTQGADVVLKSSEGVKFATHSFILKIASGIYRRSTSLPDAIVDSEGALLLPEDCRTMNAILRMISGMELPSLDNFADLEKVLLTAKKWDMPGPPSIIRRMTLSPSLLDDPVRLYALACKVGWGEAAATAATLTLDVDLEHEEVLPILKGMQSKDVLKLLNLRTRRRDELLNFLISYDIKGCLNHLSHSNKQTASDHELSIQWQWKAFIFTAFIAIDRHPSGKTLLGPNSVLQCDLDDMRNTKCPSCPDECSFDVDGLLKALERKIAELPRTIQ